MGECCEEGAAKAEAPREGRVLFPRKGKESIVIGENQRVVPVEIGEMGKVQG